MDIRCIIHAVLLSCLSLNICSSIIVSRFNDENVKKVLSELDMPPNTTDAIHNPMEKYEKNMNALYTDETVTTHERNTPIIPEVRPNVIVGNVGKTAIIAEAYYGFAGVLSSKFSETYVRPGEKVLICFPRPYFVSALTIVNPNKIRAFVYSSEAGYESGIKSVNRPRKIQYDFQGDAVKVLLKLASVINGAELMDSPFISKNVTDLFWPKRESLIWGDLPELRQYLPKQELKSLIAVTLLLENKIRNLQLRVDKIMEESKDFDTVNHYMNILEDTEALKSQLVSSDEDIMNYYTLPLVSQAANIKMLLCTWGIAYANKLNLTDEHIEKIALYQKELIGPTISHIKKMSKIHENRIYNTSDAHFFFSNMMDVRTFMTINGLGYIPIWEHIVNRKQQLNSTYLAYSEFFGTSSFNLNNQTIENYLNLPLTPSFLPTKSLDSFKSRDQIEKIQVITCGNTENVICGLRLLFESGQDYILGSAGYRIQELNLNGARIMKMRAGGDGLIDYITFYLSDGREAGFGNYRDVPYKDFELPHHHIVSMFASNDVHGYSKQLVNIAVSYELML